MFVFGVILVRMRENADQNNSEYGHFLRSVPSSWNGFEAQSNRKQITEWNW